MDILLDNDFSLGSANLYVEPRKIDLDRFIFNFNGAFDLAYENDIFNGYLHCAESELLCVVLSAAGRQSVKTEGEVVFNFPNLIGSLNANMLYIEDPMYKKHAGLLCGWFYGNADYSHIDQVVEIVKSIASQNHIKTKNIVFVGVSSGGYAALACADKLQGVKAYAFNPQIKLSEWGYAKKFTEITGFPTEQQDILNRNDISGFLNNQESQFFLHFNSFSEMDKVHMHKVCDPLGIEIKDGLHVRGNIFVSLKSMDVENPHYARTDAADLAMAISIMGGCEKNIQSIFKAYLKKMHAVARLQDQKALHVKFFEFLNKEMPADVGRAKKLASNHIDYAIDDGYELFFYRLLYNLDLNVFQFIFYINKNNYSFEEAYISAIASQAERQHDEFLLNRDRGFMRICATPDPQEELHAAFVAFFERTYAFARQHLERALVASPLTLAQP